MGRLYEKKRLPRSRNDWYVEHKWATVGFLKTFPLEGAIWDPACGKGNVIEAARLVGYATCGSDVMPRARGFNVSNFLIGAGVPTMQGRINIVSNPPFKLARKFVERALTLEHRDFEVRHIAFLLRFKFYETPERLAWLRTTPLRLILVSESRVSCIPGRKIDPKKRHGGATGGTETYAWFIWEKGFPPADTHQISSFARPEGWDGPLGVV